MERTLRKAGLPADCLEVTPDIATLHTTAHRRSLAVDGHIFLSVRGRKLHFRKHIHGYARQRDDAHILVFGRPLTPAIRRDLTDDANMTLLEVNIWPSQVEHFAQPQPATVTKVIMPRHRNDGAASISPRYSAGLM